MKKMLFVLLVMTAAFNATAQDTYIATHYRIATLNSYQNKWIWGETKKTNMMITVDEYDVYFDNDGKTKLHLIGSEVKGKVEGGRKSTWEAIDEKKDRCQLMIVAYDDNSATQIYICYKTIRVSYTINGAD